jgi:hypothetical protein
MSLSYPKYYWCQNILNINRELLELIYFTFKIFAGWRINNNENKSVDQCSDKLRPTRNFSFPYSVLQLCISDCFVLLAFAVLLLKTVVIRINGRWRTEIMLDIKLIFSHGIQNIS